MSDRDELIQHLRAIKFKHRYDVFDSIEIADAILAAGFRRTVTPEQIETAATAIDVRLREYTGPLSGNQALGAAHVAARAFGLVPEGRRTVNVPYYSDDHVTLYHGDMRELVDQLEADAVITDPPYGETSLAWDRWPDGWPTLIPASSMWCFGSMRMFTTQWGQFKGWKLAQDIIWEKHNGTGFATDRFKRVHELALHFYVGEWSSIHHAAIREDYHGPDKHTRARDARTPHTGAIGTAIYEDDGSRFVRTVIKAKSVRGGIHPTEKPAAILAPLVEYSVPVGGLVLDPFAGSGSTLLTARSLGRKASGIEADERYCEAAAKRLSIPDLFGGAA